MIRLKAGSVGDTEYGSATIAGVGPSLYDPNHVMEDGRVLYGLSADKETEIVDLQDANILIIQLKDRIVDLEARVALLESMAGGV